MAKLKVWYKKHTKRGGKHGKVEMLVVQCPKRGKVCGVQNVCCGKHSERDHHITINCDFYGGMEFGYIKCNHPKAGGVSE